MKKFLLSFLKRGSFLVFIILEIVAFSLIIRYNKNQRDIYINSSNIISGSLMNKYNYYADYMDLKNINEQLTIENARLTQLQINTFRRLEQDTFLIRDSVQYELIPSEIINKTLNLHNNYITINKGSFDGVKKSMGVIVDNGVIGIVRNVSSRYAQVLSLLNKQIRVSVLVKNKNYLGNLSWDGLDQSRMTMQAVPKHSLISLGDTIITSGYSTVFPKGLEIGTIEKFEVDKYSGDNYIISVKLFVNMNNVSYCYVINNHQLKKKLAVELE